MAPRAFAFPVGLRRRSARTAELTDPVGVDYYPDQTSGSWKKTRRCPTWVLPTCASKLAQPDGTFRGQAEFGWLHRAVETSNKHNIAHLGTPSAAPPPWLSAKYPDIFEVNAQGQRLRPGGRRFTCPTNPVYRKLSLAIATQMAKKFGETKGVIGWQIDNELTLGSSLRCYCNFCQAGFQNWLRTRYTTLTI
jgi:beta-galactosidase